MSGGKTTVGWKVGICLFNGYCISIWENEENEDGVWYLYITEGESVPNFSSPTDTLKSWGFLNSENSVVQALRQANAWFCRGGE